MTSIILNTDSYKCSMFKQYPPGTETVYSYIESRGGSYDQTVFFGLQAFIKEYLLEPITQADIDVADQILTQHGEPFNRAGWEYILRNHGGYLPVIIKSVPEGTVVPVKNVLATIENTDPECFWLTTWLETALLRAVWYPTTVATQSWNIKQLISSYLIKTGDDNTINFKLHDFGARGVSSLESAGIGGSAHLVNFRGSDTIAGIVYARKYYGADMAGFSIPAAEHSTITSWGRDNEIDAYRNMLTNFANPGSVVAIVSDSYNIFNACESLWGGELRQEVINSGATVVIRPDSGDPATVVLKCLNILSEQFGYVWNDKGYKVINNVRVLQGDGIDYNSIKRILDHVTGFGYSADNVAFGMGGALLQKVDRDTQKWAMKCSAIKVNGVWRDVYKDPITDSGKSSKKGLVTLYKDETGYFSGIKSDILVSELQTVFYNGVLMNETTFDEIRKKASA